MFFFGNAMGFSVSINVMVRENSLYLEYFEGVIESAFPPHHFLQVSELNLSKEIVNVKDDIIMVRVF